MVSPQPVGLMAPHEAQIDPRPPLPHPGPTPRPPPPAMAGDERATLLALQRALTDEQFETLKYLLEGRVPLGELRPASRPDLCRLLLQRFPGRALDVAADLLRQLPRHDLIRLHRLPGHQHLGDAGDAAAAAPGCEHPGDTGHDVAVPRDRLHAAAAAAVPRRLSERELLQVAQKLGKEWQELGIAGLGLERSRLEQIREDEPHSGVLQRFEMLREWRRREREGATAPRLLACLAPLHPQPEVLDLLRSFQGE